MSTEKEVDADGITHEEWQAEDERWDKEQAAIPEYEDPRFTFEKSDDEHER